MRATLVVVLSLMTPVLGQVLVTPRFAVEPGEDLNGQLVLRDKDGGVAAVVAVANGRCASVRLSPGTYTCEIGLRDRQRGLVEVDVGTSGGAVVLAVPASGHAITGVLLDGGGKQPAAPGTEVVLYLGTWDGWRETADRATVVCGAGGRWYRGLSAKRHFGVRAVQASLGSLAVRGAPWPWIPVPNNVTTIDVGRIGVRVPQAGAWTFDLSPWRAGMGGTLSEVIVEANEARTGAAVRIWRPSLSDDLTLSLRGLGAFLGGGRRILLRCGRMATFVDPVAGQAVRVAPLVRVSGTLRPPVPGFPLDQPVLTVRLVDGPVLIQEELGGWGRFDLGFLAPGKYAFSTTIEADTVAYTAVVAHTSVAGDVTVHDTGVLRVGGWRGFTLPKGRHAEVVCVRHGERRIAKLCKKLHDGRWLIVVPESWGLDSWRAEVGGRNARQELQPSELDAFRWSRLSIVVDGLPGAAGVRRVLLVRAAHLDESAADRLFIGTTSPIVTDVAPGRYEISVELRHETHGGMVNEALGSVTLGAGETVVLAPTDDVVRRMHGALDRLTN